MESREFIAVNKDLKPLFLSGRTYSARGICHVSISARSGPTTWKKQAYCGDGHMRYPNTGNY